MKSCPTCQRLFPDDAGFCPIDGQELRSFSRVPVVGGEDDRRLGTLLGGRYQLRRVIADGGAGRVYEALDTRETRRVAVKLLHGEVARDEIAVQRFERELAVSKQLSHPHIVAVHDFLTLEGGTSALVMELLEGEELRSVLSREGRLSPPRLVRMLSQLARALDEAHARDLVHRDLKPDNLFLSGTREGFDVKILDFGSVRDNSSGAKKLTMAGTTIGSPYYMAPEQAQGLASLDARADVWALATIAYECLTGEVPFTGSHGPAILLSILTTHPIPPSVRAELPEAVDEVIEGGLAKDPSARTRSASALADALGRAFGLAGDHRLWAVTPEAELSRLIDGVPPAPPAGRPRSAHREEVSEPLPPLPMTGPGKRTWALSLLVVIVAAIAASAWALLD